MFQSIKYFILALSLFSILNLFRSNTEVKIPLHFEIPLIGDFLTPPVPIFYLVICSFTAGALFFVLLGALRISDVHRKKKELKKIKKENADRIDELVANAEESTDPHNDLPSIIK